MMSGDSGSKRGSPNDSDARISYGCAPAGGSSNVRVWYRSVVDAGTSDHGVSGAGSSDVRTSDDDPDTSGTAAGSAPRSPASRMVVDRRAAAPMRSPIGASWR